MQKNSSTFRSFGVENFRVFKNMTEFEFKPITILTGPNNSGKSSLLKALLLFMNNQKDVNELNVSSETLLLNDYSSNLNIETGSNVLHFRLKYLLSDYYDWIFAPEIYVLFKNSETLIIDLFYSPKDENGSLIKLQISNDDDSILLSYSIDLDTNTINVFIDFEILLKNISTNIDLIKKDETITRNNRIILISFYKQIPKELLTADQNIIKNSIIKKYFSEYRKKELNSLNHLLLKSISEIKIPIASILSKFEGLEPLDYNSVLNTFFGSDEYIEFNRLIEC